MIATEALAALFVEVADTLVVDFDIVDFLHMVTTRTADITRADAAGLVLADAHGRLQFMAASTESVKMLELFQLQAEEGPCRDCFRFGAPVINTDLSRAAGRWPRFAPEAVAARYNAVHAFPLRHRDTVIGALNLFSTAAGRIEAGDVLTVIPSYKGNDEIARLAAAVGAMAEELRARAAEAATQPQRNSPRR